jgi:hypothetical protein
MVLLALVGYERQTSESSVELCRLVQVVGGVERVFTPLHNGAVERTNGASNALLACQAYSAWLQP